MSSPSTRTVHAPPTRATAAIVITPAQIREALWYASHCCFCGFDYPAPYPYPFLADDKPHKRACSVCLWCGPAILDEMPVPPDWLPPAETLH